jgi:hypothetical protein
LLVGEGRDKVLLQSSKSCVFFFHRFSSFMMAAPGLEEKKEIAQAVMNWTKQVPKKEDQPFITWEEIELHHEGFSCISNADKYLDKLSSLHVYYNTFKVTKYQIFMSVSLIFGKKVKSTKCMSVMTSSSHCGLCVIVLEGFFSFPFFSFFLFFTFFSLGN